LKIGVIGCGTIGGEICKAVDGGLVQAALVGVSDIDRDKAASVVAVLGNAVPVLAPAEVIAAADLVVEATSGAAAPSIIRESLSASRDVMVMSVGGLLDCLDEVLALAESRGKRIYVPSGAIAGLDAVKGGVVGRVSKVTLTTRKAPRALEGAPHVTRHNINLGSLTEPTEIFSGSAREAIPAFPANINVAAALSLAGIGPDRTEVRILADPSCDRNIHEVQVEGEFGTLFARMVNLPSPRNPKTSSMAALSAIALLRRITSPLVVGT